LNKKALFDIINTFQNINFCPLQQILKL